MDELLHDKKRLNELWHRMDFNGNGHASLAFGCGIRGVAASALQWSASTLVQPGEDAMVDRLEERLDEVLGLPAARAFQAQLLRYDPPVHAVAEHLVGHEQLRLRLWRCAETHDSHEGGGLVTAHN